MLEKTHFVSVRLPSINTKWDYYTNKSLYLSYYIEFGGFAFLVWCFGFFNSDTKTVLVTLFYFLGKTSGKIEM